MPRPKSTNSSQLSIPSAELLAPALRRNLNKRQLAMALNVSSRTLDTWIARKRIPYRKLGPRMVRFDLDEVERALSRYTVREIA
jgi:excisionase family DNA binding protein